MEGGRKITIKNLGLLSFRDVWEIQKNLFNELLQSKINVNKKYQNYILTCQHTHVITLGKSGLESNIKISEYPDVEYIRIDRGGDVTYHGPGQLVVYPILDLEQFGLSLRNYIYTLEQAVIDTLSFYGIKSGRIKEYTGVWVNHQTGNPKKIAAIGVKSSRHVTMHGLAFNIKPNLKYFDLIIPCGIEDKGVTSMEKEFGSKVDFEEVSERFFQNFLSQLNLVP
ncbi:MAG: lipoyl(octanoyl) transferase LipB [Bacteroidia bacterium]|nr:lipoyl(octanoyl) transferase LipB [Bacteroidia bacterium]